MNNLLKYLGFFTSVILLSGCVSSQNQYTPPNPMSKMGKNSIIIEKNKDEVWKNLIPKLGATFFVINNLDKESGFINVSYSGNPEKYVDCGRIYSMVENLKGKRVYDFPASTAFKQYEIMEGMFLFQVSRKMNLDGRINIILQEIEKNQTLVNVNTKYIISKEATILQAGKVIPTHLNDTISFNTNYEASFSQGQTRCVSNGKLENEILSLLENN